MSPYCAAVDWGTTGFRLWLLDRDGEILSERSSAEGLKTCRDGRFAAVLEANLQALQAPGDLPVIICGMAGSRAGWREVPYQAVPVALTDFTRGAVDFIAGSRRIWILPGIAQQDTDTADIMRGEETQIRGALGIAGVMKAACMPGTHSKWVSLDGETMTRFTTFMTGELYAAIGGHTILAEDTGTETDGDTVFRHHAREALAAPWRLTARLFSLRSREILGYARPGEIAPALSGLLIGTEIAAARQLDLLCSEIALIAGGPLARRYAAAFDEAGIEFRQIDAAEAVVAGIHRAAGQLLPEPAPEASR